MPSGAPTLRTPEGEERLVAWDVACFPRGPEGAHAIRNETEETVRVLMFSSVVVPTATVYPDSDKIGIWVGDPRGPRPRAGRQGREAPDRGRNERLALAKWGQQGT